MQENAGRSTPHVLHDTSLGPPDSGAHADRLVWDLPVRIMHWTLVLAAAGAWLSHYDLGAWFAVHVFCGCTVVIVILTRVVWGFVGTRYARFTQFVRGPISVFRYVCTMNSSAGFAGHNPLGAWMVLLLLGLLLAQGVTGLLANDQIAYAGPLSGYLSAFASDRATGIHRVLANVVLAAVCVHVGAILGYLLIKRDNLILPMLHGRKPVTVVPERLAIAHSRTWLAVAIAAACTCVLLLLLYTAPATSVAF